MALDSQQQNLSSQNRYTTHLYGEKVHLLSSPIMLSLLAKLGSPKTFQPQINELVAILYSHLLDEVADRLFPKTKVKMETRMVSAHPEARYEGEIINPEVPVVTVDLARAGTLPSQNCYQKLNYLMNPELVRQDHFYIARECNKAGEVIGANISGSKIGGGVDGAVVLFPDPMGATGGTIVEVYKHYQNKVGGKPLAMAAMHLIVTPEYLKKVTNECPDLHIFALRLDRGLSQEKILESVPGTFWDQEKGLNNHQYIVPGAGGLGEIMNNSYC